ncbi:MAG TPA: lytic transglycosylase domain-containing protein [Bdellovibrionales bacterium]|jgi:soluble lytic murein transglycosylase|nr:lytic transglycosylase domain-containing protein [Bdellovibrionales bacterium]
MERLKKPQFISIAAGILFLLILFQNMSLVEFAALNIASVDEGARRIQARELLGDVYGGSFAQKLEGQEYLNYLVFQKLKKSLGSEWEQQVPVFTQTLITESKAYHFDPVFILAIMQTESQFNTRAVGTSGEIGLMQILPRTAEWIAKKYGIEWAGDDSLFDPVVNMRIGIRYFAHLRSEFDRSAHHYVPAYNMGPTNVRRLERNIASTGADFRLIRPQYAAKVLKNYAAIYQQMSLQQQTLDQFASRFEDARKPNF